MWITAKVNDETVGTRINKHSPHGVIATLDTRDVGVEVETSYADGFEAVKIENDEAGTRRCKLCSMDEDEAERDPRPCPRQEATCEAPDCLCDGDSDHYGHVIEDAYMSWFEGAKVEVDEEHERVTVELRVAGKRFQMYVTRLSDDVPDGGALVLEVPGTDPNVLRQYGDSATNRVIVGTEPTTTDE